MLEKCGPLQLGGGGAGGGGVGYLRGTTGSLGLEVKQLSINRSQKRCTCIVLYKVTL